MTVRGAASILSRHKLKFQSSILSSETFVHILVRAKNSKPTEAEELLKLRQAEAKLFYPHTRKVKEQ